MKTLFKEINLDVINWALINKRIPSNFLISSHSSFLYKVMHRSFLRDLYSELPQQLQEILNKYRQWVEDPQNISKKSVILTGHDSHHKDIVAIIILLYHLNKGLKVQYYSHPNYKLFELAPATAIMRLPLCDKFNIPIMRSAITQLIISDKVFIVSCEDKAELSDMIGKDDSSFLTLLHNKSIELKLPYIEGENTVITCK